MAILLCFAVLAGAGTALSPCVLPVLPALLASGGAGGRRRPLGVVLGLSVTFAVTIIGIAKVAGGVGLGTDPLRAVAVVVLLGAGVILLVPGLGDRIEARMSRLAAFGAGRMRSAGGTGATPSTGGDGFRSGLLVGAALGFVYTPCAGPILAAVISVGAATGRSVAVGIAYTLGSAAALLVLTLGGRALFERVRAAGRGPTLQRTLGAIMVATALVIVTGEDVHFDQYIAQHIPNVNLTATLEKSHAVESRLHEITGRKARFTASVGTPVAAHDASQGTLLADAGKLPVLASAPEFKETEDWFNTPGNRPLSLSGLRGRVVLVDFWTYTCINCIRTLPYLKAWYAAYHNEGLTIVGVETPEFQFEHVASNVASAISTFGIQYPVAQDNEYGTWDAYSNEYWPADYLIDAHGHIRYVAFGEGDYDKTESAIRALLAEAGHQVGGKGRPTGVIVPSAEASPETYLGTARAQGWVNGPVGGVHDYGAGSHPNLELSSFAYTGTWNISEQPAVAVANAGIEANVEGKHVYLVLSSAGKVPRHVEVLLDGRPIPAADAGADVHHGIVTVQAERLYSLVSLPYDQHHLLTLRFQPGVTGYAFTFG
ncbi:MAG TPA: redoxin domain-containing protein [Solirubrobacteraceae bacterium]|jgi:cytochrome c biogenesis protein CcdA/thiol-disulfide isomerase/thioredoxin|nr:redoxin domain-containing protein [Solirubrobacteraceae bacterium]